ncbi:hypothetical protein [Streptomyces sp. bgisy100]|uniref:hypothetical protein n=1 Tax=Streptomyces sp. bgisy100 TaxID=3413783 RepID=UPI003D74D0FD
MVEYVIPLAAALVGGTAGFWLLSIRDRVRLNLNLISITKGRHPDDMADVGDRMVEISESFRLSDLDLEKHATDSKIQCIRSRAKDVQAEAPGQVDFAREMRRRIWHCRSTEDKIDFMTELMNDGELTFREITTGVRRNELVLSKETDGKRGEASDICSVETQTIDGSKSVAIIFPPDRRHSFTIDSPALEDRVLPLVEAIKIFDKEALDKCLGFAIDAIKYDQSRADILMGGLREIVDSGPFRVDLMIVNKGNRAAVLSPYAALTTSGATSSLPVEILRIETILDSENEPTEVPASSFVSIGPHAAVTLILRSDPIEASAPLAAAYDKGILSCSIALARLKSGISGNLKYKVEKTVHKDFGADFDEKMREKVLQLADHH